MSIRDHLGNEYKTKKERAKAYDLTSSCVTHRIKIGMSLEEALTTPAKDNNSDLKRGQSRECVDHFGNVFPSVKAMCKHYNVPESTFRKRRKAGKSIKECLQPFDRVLEKYTTSGFKIKRIKNINKNHVLIEFEDGMRTTVWKSTFLKGGALYPGMQHLCFNTYQCNNVTGQIFLRYQDTVYYKCQCKKCNWEHRKILTAQQFLQHGKECT